MVLCGGQWPSPNAMKDLFGLSILLGPDLALSEASLKDLKEDSLPQSSTLLVEKALFCETGRWRVGFCLLVL